MATTATNTTCGVCTTGPRKYKCPLCRLPYCSTACYKVHKEVPCIPQSILGPSAPATSFATDGAPTISTSNASDEDDDIPLLTSEQLAVLSMSEKVKKALQDPATRNKIKAV
ncbi:hypothetical protein, variant [Aphanomyces invadans]|uniref:HIT-type domain-containing protein n=1 Tax=Aphanomyces invadans TaxID=157072 RepID=A0A024UJZ0_9STRA|nr:hypothetical protein, variant [Aphanomyces invadans]ETW06480.1 hypothetical protein, variant [Aphanomyces invadans]|eukprot:XP_008864555.1 hypothetical protein, variant [Aphanomyces invadans]